uniref:hypothetical protein n=1 Tax=Kitasatospora sp. MY 5-36 TaxID=1678027 RepID=UPI000670A1F6
ATRPKPTTPRRPTSPVGRALNSSRQTVKAALNRVRTAARTLGRKVLNSKLGRALTNGAHRIRDAYRKQRDRLRTWHQKRQQQRAQRRAHENSPEAKQQRLDLIVARIRPRIQSLLGRGIPTRVLGGVLGAMRLWYRLTRLDIDTTGQARLLRALLNPTADVTDAELLRRIEILSHVERRVQEVLADRAANNSRKAPGDQAVNFEPERASPREGEKAKRTMIARNGAEPVDVLAETQLRKSEKKSPQALILDEVAEMQIVNRPGDPGGRWDRRDRDTGKIAQGEGKYDDLFVQLKELRTELGDERFKQMFKSLLEGNYKDLPAKYRSKFIGVGALYVFVRVVAEGQRRPGALVSSMGELNRMTLPHVDPEQELSRISKTGPMVADKSVAVSNSLSFLMKEVNGITDEKGKLARIAKARNEGFHQDRKLFELSKKDYESAAKWPKLKGISKEDLPSHLETPGGMLHKLIDSIERTLEDEEILTRGTGKANTAKAVNRAVDTLLRRWGWIE